MLLAFEEGAGQDRLEGAGIASTIQDVRYYLHEISELFGRTLCF